MVYIGKQQNSFVNPPLFIVFVYLWHQFIHPSPLRHDFSRQHYEKLGHAMIAL